MNRVLSFSQAREAEGEIVVRRLRRGIDLEGGAETRGGFLKSAQLILRDADPHQRRSRRGIETVRLLEALKRLLHFTCFHERNAFPHLDVCWTGLLRSAENARSNEN